MTPTRHHRPLFALLLTAVLAACSPADPVPSSGTTAASQGGTVSSASTQATLSIPAGGLSADSLVMIAPFTGTTPAPAGLSLVAGSAVTVSGNGGAALNSGTLNLPFSASAVGALGLQTQADPAALRLYQLVGQVWQRVQGTPTISASLYSQLISAFGTYALFAPTTPVVNPPATDPVASIQLVCMSSVFVGATTTCAAKALNTAGVGTTPQPAFTWASSDPGKARVDASGTVTGVAAGTATITASAAGKTSNVQTIAVNSSVPVGGTEIVRAANGKVTYVLRIGRGGQVFYVDNGLASVRNAFLYDKGTTTALPALADYSPVLNVLSTKFSNMACVDPSGNTSFAVRNRDNNSANDRVAYFNRAANTVSLIPFPGTADNPVIVTGCTSAGQVLGKTMSSSSSTVWDAYIWTPGAASAVTISKPVDSCTQCSAVDMNAAGTVLYQNGTLKGGVFSKFVAPSGFGSANGWKILDDGSVFGLISDTSRPVYNQVRLFKAAAGQAITVFDMPPVDAATELMLLLDVNASGEALVQAGNVTTGMLSFWLYRAGTWVEVNPTSGYSFTGFGGLSDAGQVLIAEAESSTLSGQRVVLLKP